MGIQTLVLVAITACTSYLLGGTFSEISDQEHKLQFSIDFCQRVYLNGFYIQTFHKKTRDETQ